MLFLPSVRPGAALLAASLLAGCALQPPAATPPPQAPAHWALSADHTPTADAPWWMALGDPALPPLMAAAERQAPTLQLAWLRIDEARATLGTADARRAPQLTASASSGRGNNQSLTLDTQNVGTLGLNLGWELDLFGRLRHGSAAAQARLDARTHDAQSTRLALQASLAQASVARWACGALADTQAQDVASRERTLALIERKLAAGLVAETERSRAQSGLSTAQGTLTATRAQCEQWGQALVALSTLPWPQVQALYAQAPAALPTPPALPTALPATVLNRHPALQAAARTADAAHEDVGAAQAARLPSLSLSGLLAGQWIGLAGATVDHTLWSLGASSAVALLDGGAGQQNVQAAQARHGQAMAQLQQTLLTVVQEVENGLSDMRAAQQREQHAQVAWRSAQQLFQASEASWQAGRLSLFELEDTRRTLQTARSAWISAQADHAQAWIALTQATGNGLPIAAPPPSAVPTAPATPPASGV